MGDLVKYIAVNLVDKPDQVQVEVKEGENSTVIELRVAPEDMGKVIGKQGRIAKAIRTVVRAASVRENKKYVVEIIG
ncbi:MAG: KH domain-containing protein [Christensenellales bacterium]|nr:KH domain-containing protein [Christensenellales bacterium]